jgi:hypothetical protein
MEWHLAHTIIAAFFALLGFLMDVQSLSGGLRYLKTGRQTPPVLYIPAAAYGIAVLAWDASGISKAEAFGVGLLVHVACTLGIRSFRRR